MDEPEAEQEARLANDGRPFFASEIGNRPSQDRPRPASVPRPENPNLTNRQRDFIFYGIESHKRLFKTF